MTNLGCIGNCQDLDFPGNPLATDTGIYRIIYIWEGRKVMKGISIATGEEIIIPADVLPDESDISLQVLKPDFNFLEIAGETVFQVKISGDDKPEKDCIC